MAMNVGSNSYMQHYLQNMQNSGFPVKNGIGKTRGAKGGDKAEASDKAQKAGFSKSASSASSLSETQQKAKEALEGRYENTEVLVAKAGEDMSGKIDRSKEFSIILSEDELNLLASEDPADEEAKNALLDKIDQTMDAVKSMGEKIQEMGLGGSEDEESSILSYGVSIGEDGTVSMFAELDKTRGDQQKQIEQARQDRRAERKEAEEKLEEKRAEKKEAAEEAEETGFTRPGRFGRPDMREFIPGNREKPERITAASAEELLEKLSTFVGGASGEE